MSRSQSNEHSANPQPPRSKYWWQMDTMHRETAFNPEQMFNLCYDLQVRTVPGKAKKKKSITSKCKSCPRVGWGASAHILQMVVIFWWMCTHRETSHTHQVHLFLTCFRVHGLGCSRRKSDFDELNSIGQHTRMSSHVIFQFELPLSQLRALKNVGAFQNLQINWTYAGCISSPAVQSSQSPKLCCSNIRLYAEVVRFGGGLCQIVGVMFFFINCVLNILSGWTVLPSNESRVINERVEWQDVYMSSVINLFTRLGG
jgi:hypothetical protein